MARRKKTTHKHKASESRSYPHDLPLQFASEVDNVLPASIPGVHLWHGDPHGANWMIGCPERFRRSNFGSMLDEIPDLSIDPADNLLTVINPTSRPRSFHISVEACVTGKAGQPLAMGKTRTEQGEEIPCVALVLLVPPLTSIDVCQINMKGADVSSVVCSDVVEWKSHPSPDDKTVGYCMPLFPLGGSGPFVVSQGCGGGLTHFTHPSTFHAIDFECPVGTPVLAIDSGVIVDVQHRCSCSGLRVSNLFQWNSITLMITNTGPPSAAEDDNDANDEVGGGSEESDWEDFEESELCEAEKALEHTTIKSMHVFVEYVHIQVSIYK